jgi:ApaG protein
MAHDRPPPPGLDPDPDAALAEAMENAPCYEATTGTIRVIVRTFWLDDQSQPEEHRFAWAYRIRIENHGGETVQLLRRTWEITDATGRIEHVHGDGVVGEQPILEPSQAFEYTSGAALQTPTGFMRGRYHMIQPLTRQSFDVQIPPFSLDCPYHPAIIH